MEVKQFLIMGASVLTLSVCGPVLADETQGPYVRLAEPEVDPVQRLHGLHRELVGVADANADDDDLLHDRCFALC